MRRAALALSASLLAACGSSSSSPAAFGGWVHTSGTAIVFPATDCSVAGIPGTTSASGVLVALTDFANACTWITDIQMCGSRASATFVLTLSARGAVGGTAPPMAAGTYPVLTGPPSTATFAGSIGSALRTDAICGATQANDLAADGGSVVITSITTTNVTGTVDVHLTDGSHYRQPFDVARCDPPASICSLLPGNSCAGPYTCAGLP